MINENESKRGILMNLATRVYELFKDDEIKARGLAEIFEIIEDRFLPRIDSATKLDIKQSQLELTLEIEKIRNEIEQVRSGSNKNIELLRSDLSKEIELLRKDSKNEIEQARSNLSKEIELLRKETKNEIELLRSDSNKYTELVRSDLSKKIELVRSDLTLKIEKNNTKIEEVRTDLMKHMNRQVLWIITAISIITGSMVGLLKLLDYFIK